MFCTACIGLSSDTTCKVLPTEPKVATEEPFGVGACFDTAEDAYGRIYAAGEAGIACWDGAHWTRLCRLPVTSYHRMSHLAGRLYFLSGGNLYRGDTEILASFSAESVSAALQQSEHPSDFQELVRVGDALFAMNATHILKLTITPDGTEKFEVLFAKDLTMSQTRFWRIRPAGSDLLVQTGQFGDLKNNGLLRIDGGNLDAITVLYDGILHLIDFAAIDDVSEELLLLTTSRLARRRDGKTEWLKIDEAAIPKGERVQLLQLHSDSYNGPIVQTANHGIFVLSKDGMRVEQWIKQDHIPGAVTINSDSIGRLWVPAQAGLHRCELSSGVVNVPMPLGISRVTAHGQWLVGASLTGLHVARLCPESGMPLEPLKPVLRSWIHDVTQHGNRLLVSAINGIYTCDLDDAIDNPSAFTKTNIPGPYTQQAHPIDSDNIIVVYDDRIERWKKFNEEWMLDELLCKMRAAGKGLLLEDAFWIAESRQTGNRLVQIELTSPPRVNYFDDANGAVFQHAGNVYCASNLVTDDFKVFNPVEKRFELAPALSNLRTQDGEPVLVGAAIPASPDKYWFTTYNSGLVEVDFAGKEPTLYELLSPRYRSVSAVSQGPQGIVWASTWKDSCVAIKRGIVKPSFSQPTVFLSDIGVLQPRSAANNLPVETLSPDVDYVSPFHANLRMAYTPRTLRLSFGVPQALNQAALRFQYRLLPQSSVWSPPLAERFCDYPAIREGDYEFQVRAVLADGSLTTPSTVSVHVDPPWQRSSVTYCTLVLLGACGALVIYRRRSLRQAKHTAALELEIERRILVENDLRKSQQEVIKRERLAALNEMAASVAHDLNNMLGPIAIYNELAQIDTSLPDVIRQRASICTTLANDAAEIIRRLNPLYRPLALKQELIDVPTIIEQCAEITRGICAKLGKQDDIAIEVQCEPAQVQFSASELREVITNLTSNAIDAIDTAGTLTLRCGKLDSCSVYIEIVDNGRGMGPEIARNCFNRHYTFGKTGGSGIGLAISESIINSHGGTISVDSALGKGTTMKIQIPISPNTFVSQQATNDSIDERHILVVDDVKVTRDGVCQLLHAIGQHVNSVDSAGEALKWLAKNRCDLVLTDYNMKGMNGYQLCKEIRRRFIDVRVAIMTGREEPGIRESADALLLKPISSQSVKSVLRQLPKH